MYNLKIAFIGIIFLVKCFTKGVQLQEILSTNYTCADTLAELSCPKDYIIFVSRIEYKYTSGQCIYYDDATTYLQNSNLDDGSLEDCIGIESQNDYYTTRCNGQQNCFVKIEKRQHKTGFYGTNCDFESNMANIYYTCIPIDHTKDSHKRFSICDPSGPDTILGLENGFIHSPDFPDYYGNNHDCWVNIGVPKNKRLVVYLLKMNLEGFGMFREPKDYLNIDNGPKLYGKMVLPHIIYNSSDREKVHLSFKTDWITMSKLSYPKGFLVFFALYNIHKPTTTIMTTTTTSTTTTQTTETTTLPSTTIFKDLLNVSIGISQKRETLLNALKREEESDRVATIITILVATIGLLIVIIFGLMFMFRKRPNLQDEEDNIYAEDKKSKGDDLYTQDIKKTDVTQSKIKFSSKLQTFYNNLTQTLNNSNEILNNVKQNNKFDIEPVAAIKTFNVNEYNPSEIDCKLEKNIPIESLKVLQKESKLTNIELEHQRNVRTENPYVSNPTSVINVDSEIYQSIPEQDFENENLDTNENIYSTPTNIRLNQSANSSKLCLLNESKTETDA